MKIILGILCISTIVLGKVIPRLSGRIVGGHRTTIEKHPYQISLHLYGQHNCGGSIINTDTILTAAHCVYKYNQSDLMVRVGSTDRRYGESYDISEIIKHPEYDNETFTNDVAIIKLSRPLTYSDTVQPIELQPAGNEVPAGTVATVSGWGKFLFIGVFSPNKLYKVDLDVITREECRTKYNFTTISDDMLCTHTRGKGVCQGDSGGPLVANGKLIGVVSWSSDCGSRIYPAVFANVAALHDFIDKYA